MGLRDLIKKNEVSDKLSKIKITVAGRPKVGKTSLFYEILKREGGLDTGLLIAFERGYNFLPGINVIDINSWEEFIDVIDALEEDSEGFQYLGLDTVDIAGKLCEKYILRKASRKDGKRYETLSDVPFGKAYDLLQDEFSTQLLRLERLGFGLFFITHDKDRTVKEKSGLEYEKTSMSVAGRTGDYIKNSSDFLVFIDVENVRERDEKTKKRTISENRVIRFRGDGTTEAGGRITDIEETIPYNVDLFLESIRNAINRTSEKLVSATPSSRKTRPKLNKKTVDETDDISNEDEQDVSENFETKPSSESNEDLLNEVKEKLDEHIQSLNLDEKRALAKLFKKELGVANYKKSDDLEGLQRVLDEISQSED